MTLLRSTPSELLVLYRVTDSGVSVPLARSYDGYPWEATAGVHMAGVGRVLPLELLCAGADAALPPEGSTACEALLPPLAAGAAYRIDSHYASAPSTAEAAARFLTQATFGNRATAPRLPW